MMNRSKINKLITANLWIQNYGRGYSYYNVRVNGKPVGSMSAARAIAKEGDEIRFVPGNRHYRFYVSYFVIQDDDQLLADYDRHTYPNTKNPDKNRQKVYSWERELDSEVPENKRRLPDLGAAKALVDEIFSDYNLLADAPKVVFNKRLRQWNGWYIGWTNTIELHYPSGLAIKTVIHEAAHALVRCQHGPGHKHGKVFVATLVELYQLYLPVSSEFNWEAWLERGVKLGSRYNPVRQDSWRM